MITTSSQGYEVTLYIFFPVNPCVSSNPCQHGGICVGTSGQAICDCSSVTGYDSTTCNDDIDECTASELNVHQCLNNGVCQNTDGGYDCDCTDTEYIGNRCENSRYLLILLICFGKYLQKHR